MQDVDTTLQAATDRLRSHLENYGLPPGAAIDVEAVMARYAVSHSTAALALESLLAEGLIQPDTASSFRVATDDARLRRDLLARIGPVLVSMGQIAATNATPADVYAMTMARNRMDAAIAVLDSAARAQAYRDFIVAWAAATGNAFYVAAAAMLLREGDEMLAALTRIDLGIYTSNSDGGELRRLVDAVAAGSAILAAQAAQDHAMIITHRVDGLDLRPLSAFGSTAASPDQGPPASTGTSARPSMF